VQRRVASRAKFKTGNLFDMSFFEGLIADIADPILREAIMTSIKDALEDMNIQWDNIRSDYDDIISSLTEQSTSKMIEPLKTIDKDIKKSIQKFISDNPNLKADELLKGLQDLVSDKFSVYTASRLRMIAQTTSTFTYGAAQRETHKKHGFKSVWRHTGAGVQDRKTHIAADGQVIGEDGYFNVGGEKVRHPADGSASNAINCHCILRAARE
jgi:hypothetical protein